jgi:lipoprotein NlpI
MMLILLQTGKEAMTIYTAEFGTDSERICEESERYFDLYVNGSWDECKNMLQAFRTQWPDDGPSRAIWKYMEELQFNSPQDWKGTRQD